jgi:hypothetical protein
LSVQFSVRVSAYGFPPAVPTIGSVLQFTPHDLAHALFTTGRAPGDQANHGMASVWEFLHRASLIPSYVRMTPSGRLTRSNLAVELDRSEKVALSYSLGQAMTSIFCRHMLDVPHLLHVDRYARRFGVRFGATGKRPDLIGLRETGWVVAEAKGRSNRMEPSLQSKLVDQKRAISSIEGQPPELSLGCVASFPPNVNEMVLNVFDPTEDAPQSIDLPIDRSRYLLA